MIQTLLSIVHQSVCEEDCVVLLCFSWFSSRALVLMPHHAHHRTRSLIRCFREREDGSVCSAAALMDHVKIQFNQTTKHPDIWTWTNATMMLDIDRLLSLRTFCSRAADTSCLNGLYRIPAISPLPVHTLLMLLLRQFSSSNIHYASGSINQCSFSVCLHVCVLIYMYALML